MPRQALYRFSQLTETSFSPWETEWQPKDINRWGDLYPTLSLGLACFGPVTLNLNKPSNTKWKLCPAVSCSLPGCNWIQPSFSRRKIKIVSSAAPLFWDESKKTSSLTSQTSPNPAHSVPQATNQRAVPALTLILPVDLLKSPQVSGGSGHFTSTGEPQRERAAAPEDTRRWPSKPSPSPRTSWLVGSPLLFQKQLWPPSRESNFSSRWVSLLGAWAPDALLVQGAKLSRFVFWNLFLGMEGSLRERVAGGRGGYIPLILGFKMSRTGLEMRNLSRLVQTWMRSGRKLSASELLRKRLRTAAV